MIHVFVHTVAALLLEELQQKGRSLMAPSCVN